MYPSIFFDWIRQGYLLLTLVCCCALHVRGQEFRVVGTRIFDPAGQEFVPKGTNVSGLNWDQPREITQDLERIVTGWRCNTVRVNNFLTPRSNSFTANNNLDRLIELFTRRGVVVMLAAHDWTGTYPTNADLARLTTWHRQLAERYRDNPYVWFNVMNEPGNNATFSNNPTISERWDVVHRTVIEAIRYGARSRNIIVCDGGAYGQEGNVVGDDVPDAYSALLTYGPALRAYENIVFSFHVYEQWNNRGVALANYVTKVQSRGLAVLVGEYGESNGFDGNNQIRDTRNATELMWQVCRPRNIGRLHFGWAYPGITANYTTTGQRTPWEINDFTNPTNLTDWGRKVWEDLHRPETLRTIAPDSPPLIVGVPPVPATGSRLVVAPNPGQEVIQVRLQADEAETATLTLVDQATGRIWYRQPWALQPGTNALLVKVRPLPAGLYVVQVRTRSGMRTRKWLRQP